MRIKTDNAHLPYAVVIDLDHFLGLQTARIFARHNIPVIGFVNNKHHYACKTKVCKSILQTDTKNEQLIKDLISLGKRFSQKAVLVPCNDVSVSIISKNRQHLQNYYHFSLPESDVLKMLMHKPSFYKYAVKNNFPVAPFHLITNENEAIEAANTIRFPCILKPSHRTSYWESNTNIKAFKIKTKTEFLKTYKLCSDWTDLLLAQEWINGKDSNNYSCNCYFDKNSNPIVTFIAKKLRQWPTETGNTSLGIECENEVVLNESLRLFKKVGLRGLGYLEMKRDEKSGKYYIIEPNIGRPTGRSALAEASGVELLYTMYCDLVGLPFPKNRKQKYINMKWIHLRGDFLSALTYWRRRELTIKEWFNSWRGAKAYAVFSWYDPLPFISEVNFGIYYLLRKIWRKLRQIKQ